MEAQNCLPCSPQSRQAPNLFHRDLRWTTLIPRGVENRVLELVNRSSRAYLALGEILRQRHPFALGATVDQAPFSTTTRQAADDAANAGQRPPPR